MLPLVACSANTPAEVNEESSDGTDPADDMPDSALGETADADEVTEEASGQVGGAVEISSVEFAGRLWDPFLPPLDTGTEVTIDGWLTIPASTEPVPAVVLTHGCGGPGGERVWADVLADAEIATLVLDSFGARGVTEICSGRETLNVADPIVDAYRAAQFLRQHPRIDPDAIAVMGFSFGGRTALWSALRRFQEAYGGEPFAAHVAFYPSTCYIQLDDEADVTGGPIRIFHGTADDWTPIGQCEDMVDRMASGGADAEIVPYDGALHSFDNRTLAWAVRHQQPSAVSPRACTFVERDGAIIDPDTGSVAGVGSPCVERGVTYGYDADAHEASERDLLALLDDAFDR